MTANKKIIIIVSCIAIAAGGTFGGYKINEVRKKNNTVVNVAPVSYMMNNFWGDELQLEGMVSSGDVQKIMQNESMLIEEILVKEGDKVKKGDPIVKYDATLLELDLKQKKNALAVAEDKIKQAEKELKRLEGLNASEDIPPMPAPTMPEVTEPQLPNVVTLAYIAADTPSFGGDGSDETPFRFNCEPDTVVSADFLNLLSKYALCADFNVYENNMLSYSWSVDGSKLDPELISDWTLGGNVQTDGIGNVKIDYSEVCYGTFESYAASEPDDTSQEFDYSAAYDEYEQSYINSGSDDYMYSRAELKKMKAEKEEELKRLGIEQKKADVAYRQVSAKKINNMAVSNIDGVVTLVNTGKEEQQSTDSALVVIQSGKEATVKVYIGELNLDKISIGSTVNIMSYNTGTSSEAEVTSIDMTPVTDRYSWNDNPNSSTYSFNADVTGNTEGLNVGDWVSVSINNTEIGNTFYIPLHYTREEDGRYYVMKAGKNGRLKKQYINTGKIVYGSQIEIKGGITADDKLCFPYGKNVKEGVKTKETEEVQW